MSHPKPGSHSHPSLTTHECAFLIGKEECGAGKGRGSDFLKNLPAVVVF